MDWKLISITYNVNRQKPTRESVQAWLSTLEEIDGAQIVCFAMQEVPHAEVFKATATHRTWSEQLTIWLNQQHNFSLVNKLCLASNMLLIYIKLDLLQTIGRIDTRWCRSTLFGTVGYKGTISTKLEFRFGIILVFITSHFFHDEKFFRERIKQFHQSLSCTFPEVKSPKKFTFWLGDLNSRLEGFANSSQLIAMLNQLDDIDELARMVDSYDQLANSKRNREAFVGFDEATIRFKPTYRILVGSGSFDPVRIPSWCDRILYSSSSASSDDLRVDRYTSCRRITLSDHFPVAANFTLRIQPQHLPYQSISDPQVLVWPCHFEHIPTWEECIPLVCRLCIPTEQWTGVGSNLDWMGLYPASMEMISRPLEWVYLLTCPFDEQRRLVAEFPPLNPGIYRVGYFCSQTSCLLALSNPFRVRSIEERPK